MTTRVCEDHHVCRNDSVCMEHPDFPGSYTCECVGTDDQVYAGLSCDHLATSFCNGSGTPDVRSFCTNNGECVNDMDETGFHFGCECPVGYKGDVRIFGNFGIQYKELSKCLLDTVVSPILMRGNFLLECTVLRIDRGTNSSGLCQFTGSPKIGRFQRLEHGPGGLPFGAGGRLVGGDSHDWLRLEEETQWGRAHDHVTQIDSTSRFDPIGCRWRSFAEFLARG